MLRGWCRDWSMVKQVATLLSCHQPGNTIMAAKTILQYSVSRSVPGDTEQTETDQNCQAKVQVQSKSSQVQFQVESSQV